jgi:hypothetical protein
MSRTTSNYRNTSEFSSFESILNIMKSHGLDVDWKKRDQYSGPSHSITHFVRSLIVASKHNDEVACSGNGQRVEFKQIVDLYTDANVRAHYRLDRTSLAELDDDQLVNVMTGAIPRSELAMHASTVHPNRPNPWVASSAPQSEKKKANVPATTKAERRAERRKAKNSQVVDANEEFPPLVVAPAPVRAIDDAAIVNVPVVAPVIASVPAPAPAVVAPVASYPGLPPGFTMPPGSYMIVFPSGVNAPVPAVPAPAPAQKMSWADTV